MTEQEILILDPQEKKEYGHFQLQYTESKTEKKYEAKWQVVIDPSRSYACSNLMTKTLQIMFKCSSKDS